MSRLKSPLFFVCMTSFCCFAIVASDSSPEESPEVAIIGMSSPDFAKMTEEEMFHWSDREFQDFRLAPAVSQAESVTGSARDVSDARPQKKRTRSTMATRSIPRVQPMTCLAVITQANLSAQLQTEQQVHLPTQPRRASGVRAAGKRPTLSKKPPVKQG